MFNVFFCGIDFHSVMRKVLPLIRVRFCWSVLLSAFLPGPVLAQALPNLNLSLVSNVKPSANPISYGDVWAEGDLACLGVWLNYSTYNYGVGIYSVSNPAAPVLLSIYSPSPTSQNQFELGAVRNRIGYFGSWSGGGLHIVSLTNAASPQLLCRVGATTGNVTNGFDRVHTIFLERNFLYEAAHVVCSEAPFSPQRSENDQLVEPHSVTALPLSHQQPHELKICLPGRDRHRNARRIAP